MCEQIESATQEQQENLASSMEESPEEQIQIQENWTLRQKVEFALEQARSPQEGEQSEEKKGKKSSSTIYGLKLRNKRGIYTVRSEGDFRFGDEVLVKSTRGKEVSKVQYVGLNSLIRRSRDVEVESLLRGVTEQDRETMERNREKEKTALEIAGQKAKDLNLNMRFVGTEYLFDSSRILFFFLAPQKVDFRELVKLLSKEFRTRIELRQLSSREYVGLQGALGACGRETCCSSFLSRPPRVTLKMVENQRLSKNPSKLNGVCGKLKCCLSYENDFYHEALEGIPAKASCIGCSKGKGKVCGTNIFSDEVTIRLEDNSYVQITLEEARTAEVLDERSLNFQSYGGVTEDDE